MKRKLNFENVLSQHFWHIREKSLYALRPVIIFVVLFAGYMTYDRMISSPAINVIRQEMQLLIEREESVPDAESRTSMELNKTQPGQDNVSERPSLETVPPP